MVHMSNSLGVNCTYCHNTRAWGEWSESRPQRTVAWHGIRMARQLNNEYLVPLTNTFPDHRLGPTGDVAKINCQTCHQGVYKPYFGQSMAKDYPELQRAKPMPEAAPAAETAEGAEAAADAGAAAPAAAPVAAPAAKSAKVVKPSRSTLAALNVAG
jgi:photosynthetic reaction center cytochrome c subunit